jgi:hypothetical protein
MNKIENVQNLIAGLHGAELRIGSLPGAGPAAALAGNAKSAAVSRR